jgi:hypothetical protein
VNGQQLENPFASAFRTSSLVLVLIFGAFLCIFVPPLMVLLGFVAVAYLWAIARYPLSFAGAMLAFMPMDYMAIEFGKFFGLPSMTVVSAFTKEIPLLLLIFVLWRRNGFKPTLPDWFLFGFLAFAAVRTALDGTLLTLATDIQFALPYSLGRVAVLSTAQEGLWARRAVWIVGILSILGMSEIFIFGAGPRAALYAATEGVSQGGNLSPAFYGQGFGGMREASTMVGPPSFAALCMIALIVWWVYGRSLLPAAMVAAGLLCSVTRSSWLGTALAIFVLGIIMNQKKRLLRYAAVALMLFAAAIPILGLGDYLSGTSTGKDESAQNHRRSILTGLKYIGENPFGGGNLKIGPRSAGANDNALVVETTYLEFAAEYGVVAFLIFLGFMLSALRLAWRQQSQLGYVAVGILIGLGLAMTVLILHDDRRLACWEWFPVGLAVRSSMGRSVPASSGSPEKSL